jgi:hypothetical protein
MTTVSFTLNVDEFDRELLDRGVTALRRDRLARLYETQRAAIRRGREVPDADAVDAEILGLLAHGREDEFGAVCAAMIDATLDSFEHYGVAQLQPRV